MCGLWRRTFFSLYLFPEAFFSELLRAGSSEGPEIKQVVYPCQSMDCGFLIFTRYLMQSLNLTVGKMERKRAFMEGP